MLPSALPKSEVQNLLVYIYKNVYIYIYMYIKYILYVDPVTMHTASNKVTRAMCLSATLD